MHLVAFCVLSLFVEIGARNMLNDVSKCITLVEIHGYSSGTRNTSFHSPPRNFNALLWPRLSASTKF